MVATRHIKYLEKESIIHYELMDIKYFAESDKFKVRLTSFFKGWPEIKVSVNYRNLKALRITTAYVDDVDYRLSSTNAEYVEKITEEITDRIIKKLKEDNREKDNKPKRISIF